MDTLCTMRQEGGDRSTTLVAIVTIREVEGESLRGA